MFERNWRKQLIMKGEDTKNRDTKNIPLSRILHDTHLRTIARKFSNIDFFLKILPLKDDTLVMSEM